MTLSFFLFMHITCLQYGFQVVTSATAFFPLSGDCRILGVLFVCLLVLFCFVFSQYWQRKYCNDNIITYREIAWSGFRFLKTLWSHDPPISFVHVLQPIKFIHVYTLALWQHVRSKSNCSLKHPYRKDSYHIFLRRTAARTFCGKFVTFFLPEKLTLRKNLWWHTLLLKGFSDNPF